MLPKVRVPVADCPTGVAGRVSVVGLFAGPGGVKLSEGADFALHSRVINTVTNEFAGSLLCNVRVSVKVPEVEQTRL